MGEASGDDALLLEAAHVLALLAEPADALGSDGPPVEMTVASGAPDRVPRRRR